MSVKSLLTWTEQRLQSATVSQAVNQLVFSFHSKYFVYRKLKRALQKLSLFLSGRILVPAGYWATYCSQKNFVSATCLLSCSTSFLQITIFHMDDDGIDIDKSILKAILKGLKVIFKQLFTMYDSIRQAISFSLKDTVITMALIAIMQCILCSF